MTERITVNQNFAACLRDVGNIGQRTVQNVCDGTSAIVPWGSADWLGFVALVAFAFIIAIIFGSLAKMILRDM